MRCGDTAWSSPVGWLDAPLAAQRREQVRQANGPSATRIPIAFGCRWATLKTAFQRDRTYGAGAEGRPVRAAPAWPDQSAFLRLSRDHTRRKPSWLDITSAQL